MNHGHGLVADWDASKVADTWIGQSICSFSDDGDLSRIVYLVLDPPPQTRLEGVDIPRLPVGTPVEKAWHND